MRALRLAACAIAAATVVSGALGLVAAGGVFEPLPAWFTALIVVSFLSPCLVGLAIAFRQPRNRVAWILLLGSFALMMQVPFGMALGKGWTLQLDRSMWPLLYAWPIAVAYVFPNGTLLSRRWRWVAALGIFCFVSFMAIGIIDPEPFDGKDASVPNPMAGRAAGTWMMENVSWIWVPLWLGMLATLIGGAVAIWLRLRRSRGAERAQTMWLAWSASLIPLTLLLCAAVWFVPIVGGLIEDIVFPLLLAIQVAVAVSIGVAVRRYHLYEIERIVNRTLVYAVLTILLIGTYLAVALVLGVVIGRGSEWVVAAATLAAALAFRPLRTRVQDIVDRRFSKARYHGVRRIHTFEDAVRDGRRAPEEIGSEVALALDDPTAILYLALPTTGALADARGRVIDAGSEEGRAATAVQHDGVRTAVLAHDVSLLERPQILRSVLQAATLSIEIARLRVEVRLQLAEVEAVAGADRAAGYEERRRIERDLHDGAQQRLVSLGIGCGASSVRSPERGRDRADARRGRGRDGGAITDLRTIAAGVRPARLDEGLAAALRPRRRAVPRPASMCEASAAPPAWRRLPTSSPARR